MRGASLVCFVVLTRKKTRTNEKKKPHNDQRLFERKKEIKNKKRTQSSHFVLASCRVAARWLKNASQSERKKMFVFNRDAVRELRRQLAPVVALLSDDKERVVRL